MALLRPPIRYLNTDLNLKSKDDLRPLTRALERGGMYTLHVTPDDNMWRACLEANTEARTPTGHINAMLKAIEGLKPAARKIWDRCDVREFNIGYDSGFRPQFGRFNNPIATRALLRMANLGVSLRITIYPPDEEGPPGAT